MPQLPACHLATRQTKTMTRTTDDNVSNGLMYRTGGYTHAVRYLVVVEDLGDPITETRSPPCPDPQNRCTQACFLMSRVNSTGQPDELHGNHPQQSIQGAPHTATHTCAPSLSLCLALCQLGSLLRSNAGGICSQTLRRRI